MKKSRVFTFFTAFIPGAGQMYQGMMKKGISLMLLFVSIIAISAFLNLSIFTVLLPVIWFYSFFDTFNIRNMTYEERLRYEDKFLFDLDRLISKDWASILARRHVLVGVGCVVLGIYMIYNSILRRFYYDILDHLPFLGGILRGLPSLIVALLIIWLGIHLLASGKKKLPPSADQDYVEYGGKDHE